MSKEHEPTECPRNKAVHQFIGKGWKAQYSCPTCGRATMQALNFMGGRRLICDGAKFTKKAK